MEDITRAIVIVIATVLVTGVMAWVAYLTKQIVRLSESLARQAEASKFIAELVMRNDEKLDKLLLSLH